MNFVSTISFLIIMFLSTVHIFGQNVITFDNQGWNSNQTLPSNFSIGNYLFLRIKEYYNKLPSQRQMVSQLNQIVWQHIRLVRQVLIAWLWKGGMVPT